MPIFFAVACFLPGQAKDISAHNHIGLCVIFRDQIWGDPDSKLLIYM